MKIDFSNDACLSVVDEFAYAMSGVSGGSVVQSLLKTCAKYFANNKTRFVPDAVERARLLGQKVSLHATCATSVCCWYWEMPDGQRIYHYERASSEKLRDQYKGVCPECGNTHITGGLRTV